MTKNLTRLFLAITAALTACAPSFALPRYGVTDIISPTGRLTYPVAINDLGQVAYYTWYDASNYLAGVWQNGQAQRLDALKGCDTNIATSINDRGEIVGYCWEVLNNNPIMLGFLWQNGRIKDIGHFPVKPECYDVQPTCINNSGQIVGSAGVSYSEIGAFILDKGKMIELKADPTDAFPPIDNMGPFTQATAINNRGQVVGCTNCREYANGLNTGVMWTKNGSNWAHPTITDLKGPNGSIFVPVAINDAGQVAGMAGNVENERAAIWQNGVAKILDIPAGYETSRAVGINERGEIVGEMATDQNGTHAFIWKDGVTTDLNDLLPADCGYVINSAVDINNRGQILCQASRSEDNFDAMAVLLSPLETVNIDVMPGNRLNRIDPQTRAMLEVALYSSRDFDARRIDLSTIKLAGVAPISCRRIDINRDGRSDLLLGFKTISLEITGSVTKLDLTAFTTDGWQIEGTDDVWVP